MAPWMASRRLKDAKLGTQKGQGHSCEKAVDDEAGGCKGALDLVEFEGAGRAKRVRPGAEGKAERTGIHHAQAL